MPILPEHFKRLSFTIDLDKIVACAVYQSWKYMKHESTYHLLWICNILTISVKLQFQNKETFAQISTTIQGL